MPNNYVAENVAMTKKVRHWRGRSRTSASVIKSVNKDNFASAICPTNIEDQKQKFLELGKTPEFQHRGTEDELEEIYSKPRSEIRFDLLGEAMHILKTVKEKYGDAENYYAEMYGEWISKEEATDIIVDYLKENHLDGQMSIIWCSDLPCSGRMMWQGPHVKYRRPEARKYSMWIKDSKDNNFLRLQGIRCLADHEIGTHFFRSYNDGLQPWFSDRTKFGIRGASGLDLLRTEEGLAAINTILNARVRYLWGPALLYYIACKATEMTFKQLFEHLSIYVANPEWRWRHCVRVKRGLLNPNDIGGYGKDQCYFEGAVEILRNIDTIDFKVLMSGKICYDEIPRIKKLARLNCIQMPAFMRNQEKYKKTLKQIAHMNGLHMDHAKFKAPLAYLRRLKRGRRIGVAGGAKKVRKKGQGRKGSVSNTKGLGSLDQGGMGTTFGHLGSDDDNEGSDTNDEEEFFYQPYGSSSSAPKDDFFESMKRTMEMNDGGKMTDSSEKFNFTYYKNIVENFEKLKNEQPLEDVKKADVKLTSTASTTLSTPSRHINRDWENDCPKSTYRCVSRSSVQMVLSLPSKSLNSRNRNNSHSDDASPGIPRMRPLSSIIPGRSSSSDQPEPPLDEYAGLSNVLSASTSFTYPVSHIGLQSTNTSSTCSSLELNNQRNNQAHTNAGVTLNQAQSIQNEIPIKADADGFIYPDTDILTDDMIKINSDLQSCDIGLTDIGLTNQNQAQINSPNQVKLLNRRVKSAANLLPKFTEN